MEEHRQTTKQNDINAARPQEGKQKSDTVREQANTVVRAFRINTTREPSAVLVHAVSHHTHEACVVCGCSTSDGRQPGADRWLILRNQKLRVRASWGRWMLNFENSKAMRERRALSRGIVWQALQYLQKSDHERRLAHQCGVAPLHAATRATWLTRKLLAEQPRPRFFTDAFMRFTED